MVLGFVGGGRRAEKQRGFGVWWGLLLVVPAEGEAAREGEQGRRPEMEM